MNASDEPHPEPMHEGAEQPPPGARTMGIIRWVLVGVMGLVAIWSIVRHTDFLRSPGDATSGHVHGAATVAPKMYYCPMHPQVIQDHPGECPICSMTLVLKGPGAAKAPAADMAGSSSVPGLVPVELGPERVQLIGMKTAKVGREPIGGQLRTVGVVSASERGLAQVSTRFSGFIEKLLVSQTGEKVRRGQVLALVYSPEVLRAQQELLTARGWKFAAPPAGDAAAAAAPSVHHELTHGMDADARRRLELLGVSQPEIEEVIKTGKPLPALAVRSPVDGYVLAKNAVSGASVGPGTPLYEIADLSTVWVIADVYESDVARVRPGQTARLELGAYPGEILKGKLSFVYPTVDAASRTLRVRLEFANKNGPAGPKLRPGMYGNVSLDLPATTRLVVPTEAVVDTGEVQYVFVAKDGGRFEPRRVQPGASAGGKREILSGLSEGEIVVTTANFLLDSESRLRAAIDGQPALTGHEGHR